MVDQTSCFDFSTLTPFTVPRALAELHASTIQGATVRVVLPAEGFDGDRLGYVIEGAGFGIDRLLRRAPTWEVDVTRARTLPDVVGPGMRLLVCGLNPSLYSADAGVGFARPGNRFWPAALDAGLVSVDRDPLDALRAHAIGFTDLVKRATRKASELNRREYLHGAARLSDLVGWLTPAVTCFAGLTGYRAAVDRDAAAGWQAGGFAGRPAYVMPNPSGVNAHTSRSELAGHLRRAVAGPPSR